MYIFVAFPCRSTIIPRFRDPDSCYKACCLGQRNVTVPASLLTLLTVCKIQELAPVGLFSLLGADNTGLIVTFTKTAAGIDHRVAHNFDVSGLPKSSPRHCVRSLLRPSCCGRRRHYAGKLSDQVIRVLASRQQSFQLKLTNLRLITGVTSKDLQWSRTTLGLRISGGYCDCAGALLLLLLSLTVSVATINQLADKYVDVAKVDQRVTSIDV